MHVYVVHDDKRTVKIRVTQNTVNLVWT